jgi:cell pole-organizing protein PopZ
MSNPQPEPSMEEILASIRRIISEDGEEETAPAQTTQRARPTVRQAAPVTPPAATPTTTATTTPTPVEEDRARTHLETEDVEMIKKNTAQAIQNEGEEEILAETTAAAATKAFQNLTQTIRVSDGPGRTLEDIVTDLLRPLVKEWLDSNLPAIVEEKVEEEVQRVARRRR